MTCVLSVDVGRGRGLERPGVVTKNLKESEAAIECGDGEEQEGLHSPVKFRCSDTPMFRQPYVSTPLYMFQQLNLCFDNLFRQCQNMGVSETPPYSDTLLFRHPLCSDIPMFRHPYVPTSYFRFAHYCYDN